MRSVALEVKRMAKKTILSTAKVLYNYKARSGQKVTELSIKKGDIVNVYRKFPNGWWLGALVGQEKEIGVFPCSYVKEEEKKKEKEVVMEVKEGFQAPDDQHISLQKGDQVTILEKPSQDVWRGQIGDRYGLFPSKCVLAEEEPEKQATSSEGKGSGRKKEKKGKKGKSKSRAVVKYDYKARTANELSLHQGDVVNVLDKLPTGGWWKGECNGVVGFFPGSYVKEVEGEPSRREKKSAKKSIGKYRLTEDYEPSEKKKKSALSVQKGDVVDVVEKTSDVWWLCRYADKVGYLPPSLLVDDSIPSDDNTIVDTPTVNTTIKENDEDKVEEEPQQVEEESQEVEEEPQEVEEEPQQVEEEPQQVEEEPEPEPEVEEEPEPEPEVEEEPEPEVNKEEDKEQPIENERVNELEGEVEGMKERVKGLEGEIERMKEELKKRDLKMAELEGKLQSMLLNMQSEARERRALESSVMDLQGARKGNSSAVEDDISDLNLPESVTAGRSKPLKDLSK